MIGGKKPGEAARAELLVKTRLEVCDVLRRGHNRGYAGVLKRPHGRLERGYDFFERSYGTVFAMANVKILNQAYLLPGSNPVSFKPSAVSSLHRLQRQRDAVASPGAQRDEASGPAVTAHGVKQTGDPEKL
jgi:hypothetical protein